MGHLRHIAFVILVVGSASVFAGETRVATQPSSTSKISSEREIHSLIQKAAVADIEPIYLESLLPHIQKKDIPGHIRQEYPDWTDSLEGLIDWYQETPEAERLRHVVSNKILGESLEDAAQQISVRLPTREEIEGFEVPEPTDVLDFLNSYLADVQAEYDRIGTTDYEETLQQLKSVLDSVSPHGPIINWSELTEREALMLASNPRISRLLRKLPQLDEEDDVRIKQSDLVREVMADLEIIREAQDKEKEDVESTGGTTRNRYESGLREELFKRWVRTQKHYYSRDGLDSGEIELTQIDGQIAARWVPKNDDLRFAILFLNVPLSCNSGPVDPDSKHLKTYTARINIDARRGVMHVFFDAGGEIQETRAKHKRDFWRNPAGWTKDWLRAKIQRPDIEEVRFALGSATGQGLAMFGMLLVLPHIYGWINSITGWNLTPEKEALWGPTIASWAYAFILCSFSRSYDRIVRSDNVMWETTKRSILSLPRAYLILGMTHGWNYLSKLIAHGVAFGNGFGDKMASTAMVSKVRMMDRGRLLEGNAKFLGIPQDVLKREILAYQRTFPTYVGLVVDPVIKFPLGTGILYSMAGYHHKRALEFAHSRPKKFAEEVEVLERRSAPFKALLFMVLSPFSSRYRAKFRDPVLRRRLKTEIASLTGHKWAKDRMRSCRRGLRKIAQSRMNQLREGLLRANPAKHP